MLSKEEIESWNEIFPDCKIKQAELANPIFLTKALTFYLRKFGYNINENMQLQQKNNDADNMREHRVFLIKLAQHIDRMLKITDKTYTFTYYDLIHPTQKKTSHILSILLNYLYFFNMYKSEVFGMADEATTLRDNLLKRIKEVEENNKSRKMRAEKIKDDIEEHTEELLNAQKQFSAITLAKQKQGEEMQKLEEGPIKDQKVKLDQLLAEKRNLKIRVVSEIEFKELQTQLQKLQQRIKEATEQEVATKNILKESTENIKSYQDFLTNLKEIDEKLPMDELNLLNDVFKKFKGLKIATNSKEQHKKDLLMQVDKLQNDLKSLHEKTKLLKKQNENAKLQNLEKIQKLDNDCDANEKKLAQLQHEIHLLDCQYQEQEEIGKFLHEKIEILMRPYLK